MVWWELGAEVCESLSSLVHDKLIRRGQAVMGHIAAIFAKLSSALKSAKLFRIDLTVLLLENIELEGI